MLGRKEGFTLVELLVVIAIIGLLAMIAVPRYTGFRERAQETATISELQAVRQAWNYLEAEKGEGSLSEIGDLGIYLDDLDGGEFLGKYELSYEQGDDYISAVPLESFAEERVMMNIYIDKIEKVQ